MTNFFPNMAIVLVCLTVALNAQSSSGRQPLFPFFPVILEYEYAPYFISQDIKDDPRYSLIEAIFDPQDASSVQVVLTEKDTRKRVFYCSSQTNVNLRKVQGREAYAAKIDFKSATTDNGFPTFGFGFADKHGQPVLWRVIPTTIPSERGAGLTPIATAKDLRLEYRDMGTTIGEGSAVKIGDKVSEAIPWPETSSPPYFYAFRGTFTVGRHIGALRLGSERWRVTSQPKELKKGEEWVLVSQLGGKRTMRIVSDAHDELVVDEVNPTPGASLMRIVMHLTPRGFALRAIGIKSRSREMRMKFEPELTLLPAASSESTFAISQGENKNIATGIIKVGEAQSGSGLDARLQLRTPEWAKSRVMETSVKLGAQDYSIETIDRRNQ